jgi:amino-acid N-acetyltransferase
MRIRSAVMQDIDAIQRLIQVNAQQGLLLPRGLSSLYESLQGFVVVYDEAGDDLMGTAALHILWKDLAEVRSLAVASHARGLGVGRMLVNDVVRRAALLGVEKVLSLTLQVDFFSKCGFEVVDKIQFPRKVWKDCLGCPKLQACDEVAMQINAFQAFGIPSETLPGQVASLQL